MYNEELKLRYIATLNANAPMFRNAFNLISEYENSIGRDVSEMTYAEYRECIKSTRRETVDNMIVLHTACSKYSIWKAKTFGQLIPAWVEQFDCFEEFESLGAFLPVVTWDDIYTDLLSVYPITEGYAIWPISVCAWCGLTIPECCSLKNEDVDLKNRRIHVGDEAYDIEYDSQVKIMQAYANTTLGNREQNRKYTVELLDVGYFIKFSKTKNSAKRGQMYTNASIAHQFAAMIDKAQAENINLAAMYNYSLIWNMGRYHVMSKLDNCTHGGIANIKKKDIKQLFRVKYEHPTGSMILTQYNLYKKKLTEREGMHK